MRKSLFSLLILLTALRGMVGDVMAYGMTDRMVKQTEHIANSFSSNAITTTTSDDSMSVDHFSPQQAVSMPCHEVTHEPQKETYSSACSTCQVCHMSVSLPNLQLHKKDVRIAHTLNADFLTAWLSADLALLQKPPVF